MSPIAVKSTATTFGSRPRSPAQVWKRSRSTRREFTCAASVGSGGPSGRSQWLIRNIVLSVPPRLVGTQLNDLIDENVYGVSSNKEYVGGNHLYTSPCFSLTVTTRLGFSPSLFFVGVSISPSDEFVISPLVTVRTRSQRPDSTSAALRSFGC